MRPMALTLILAACLTAGGCSHGGDNSDDPFYRFEDITTGLRSDPTSPRQLRVTFTFEIDPARRGESIQTIQKYSRMIRDRIVMYLATQSAQDVNQEKGLQQLREEVRKIVNECAGEPVVKQVILTQVVLM